MRFTGSWEELVRGRGAGGAGGRAADLPAGRAGGSAARPGRSPRPTVVRAIPVPVGQRDVLVTLVEVRYLDADPEHLRAAARLRRWRPRPRDRRWRRPARRSCSREGGGVLYDAMADDEFVNALVDGMGRQEALARRPGRAGGEPHPRLRRAAGRGRDPPHLGAARRADPTPRSTWATACCSSCSARRSRGSIPTWSWAGTSPTHTDFRRVPMLAGGLELRTRNAEPITLGVLHQFVPSEGDAWTFTLNALSRFFERALVSSIHPSEAELAPVSILELANREPPAVLEEAAGGYMTQARLLGQRTGEFHLALAADRENPAFIPEPFTGLYRRSIYQSLRSSARTHLRPAAPAAPTLPESLRDEARARARAGGHAAQAGAGGHGPEDSDGADPDPRRLPSRPGALYRQGLRHRGPRGRAQPQPERAALQALAAARRGGHDPLLRIRRGLRGPARADADRGRAGAAPLGPALAAVGLGQLPARLFRRRRRRAVYLPKGQDAFAAMLDFYLLDKAIYELRYELNNRPDWVGIPLEGIRRRLDAEAERPVGAAADEPGRRPARRARRIPPSSRSSRPAALRSAPASRESSGARMASSCAPTIPTRSRPSAFSRAVPTSR